MQICPLCGEENPERFRFCGMCGTQLSAAAATVHIRRTVTVVFCDLKGSTEMGERLDPELVREALNRYFAEMRAALERHGATVESYLGDAVLAVFGLPRAHEDDALRAVRAAREMQAVLDTLNDDLEARWGVRLANRVGINTGEVIAGAVGEQRLVTGDAVNVAARLEGAAGPMETLIGDSTYRLVRSAVRVEAVEPLNLKGKAEPVIAYRLIDVDEAESRRQLDTPLVGRAEELLALESAFARAAQANPQAAVVTGDAGSGKTRLLAEFLRRNSHARILRGRCLAYGDGITFWPLGEVVREAAAITDSDSPVEANRKIEELAAVDVARRLAAAIGLSVEPFGTADIFWAARKLFEDLAAKQPLIVVFEDVHWAEPTFLDLIDSVVGTASGAPLLVLCAARSELLESQPDWLADRYNATRLRLEPLSGDECALIIEHLLGRAGLPPAIQTRILERAEGNPLFVEQMVSILIDDGLLVFDGEGGWTAAEGASESIVVPPSISALLSARLDRLVREERAVAEAGAVAGLTFHRGAVEAVCADQVRDRVPDHLAALGRKLLIRRQESSLALEEEFRFQHGLIRDAAYQGLLKRARAEMHERLADWLVVATGARALEYEEIVGYHLEQSHHYLRELGPLDAAGAEIGLRAGRLLGGAGRRALARGDVLAAVDLLQRATAVLVGADHEQLPLSLPLSEALIEKGEFARVEHLISESIESAARLAEHGLEVHLRLVRMRLNFLTDPTGWSEAAQVQCEEAIRVFTSLGDDAGLDAAWWLIATIHGQAGSYSRAQEAIEKVIEHAARAGDRRQQTRSCIALAVCELVGPSPVPAAITRCERLLEEAEGDRRAQALVAGALAQLYAMRGDFDRARELYTRCRQTLQDLGDTLQAATTSLYSGTIELLAGDPIAAERELRRDFVILDGLGERVALSSVASLLSRALYLQGRSGDADEFSRTAEAAAAPDDAEAQVGWRQVRGLLLLEAGQIDEALGLLREAVAQARGSDSPAGIAGALGDLAVALEAGADAAGAKQANLEALALYEAKGDVVSAAAPRGALDRLAALSR
ncbi:MAG TPA: adenylate/guanylate cyclase domain-containing protein [Candidatus Dormibacteraeota bacterium]